MKSRNLLFAALLLLAGWGLVTLMLKPRDPATPDTSLPAAKSVITAVNDKLPARVIAIDASAMAGMTSRLANPLERSADLSAPYRAHEGADSPLERHLAYRAWSACFPAFLGADGRPSKVDTFVRAMPEGRANNALRIAAYTALRKRCEGFFFMSTDEIVHTTQRLADLVRKGDVASAGELSLKYQLEGTTDRALDIARNAVQAKDGYSIASLQEFVHRMLGKRIEDGLAPSSERTDLRGLAFAIAACDYGLDCSGESLTALQLCANNGQCDGSLTDRYVQGLVNTPDRDLVMQMARETSDAIRRQDFAALGLVPKP